MDAQDQTPAAADWDAISNAICARLESGEAQARWDAQPEEARILYKDEVDTALRVKHTKIHLKALKRIGMPDTTKIYANAEKLVQKFRSLGDPLEGTLMRWISRAIWGLRRGWRYPGTDDKRQSVGWLCEPREDADFWRMSPNTAAACERFFETFGLIDVKNTTMPSPERETDRWRWANVILFPRFDADALAPEPEQASDGASEAVEGADAGSIPSAVHKAARAAAARFGRLLARIAGTDDRWAHAFGLVARNHGLNRGRATAPT